MTTVENKISCYKNIWIFQKQLWKLLFTTQHYTNHFNKKSDYLATKTALLNTMAIQYPCCVFILHHHSELSICLDSYFMNTLHMDNRNSKSWVSLLFVYLHVTCFTASGVLAFVRCSDRNLLNCKNNIEIAAFDIPGQDEA